MQTNKWTQIARRHVERSSVWTDETHTIIGVRKNHGNHCVAANLMASKRGAERRVAISNTEANETSNQKPQIKYHSRTIRMWRTVVFLTGSSMLFSTGIYI